eukprot:c522_g1_i1.p1 GENE.c522_g1_i1~~c522_g1_i1.p1  ORF type:complete len:493 (+),score=88.88 c522_g1_i1:352-1830(+)
MYYSVFLLVAVAQWYASRKYFFDIHPPLAKLLLAAMVVFTGFHTDVPYRDIGKEYQHDGYIMMRMMQASFGTFLAPVCFLTMRELRVSLPCATLSSLMIVMELSMQTISRAILLDAFLHLSIALAFFSALKLWDLQHKSSTTMFWTWATLCGIFMACAFSTKHTGLGVIGVIGTIHFIKTFTFPPSPILSLAPIIATTTSSSVTTPQTTSPLSRFKARIMYGVQTRMFFAGVWMLALVIVIYILCFVVHFVVIIYSGVDEDSMSDNYRSQLINTKVTRPADEPPEGMWRSIVHINKHMLKVNHHTSFKHHHASPWYEWPFMYRGIVYWWNNFPDGTHICVYLFGNPIIFWIVLLGVVAGFYVADKKFWTIAVEPTSRSLRTWHLTSPAMFMCLYGWLVNYIPYPLLVKRTCFMYHYHPSLYFGIMLIGCMVECWVRGRVRQWAVVGGMLSIVFVCYIYYLPFSFATPITDKEHEQRRMLYFFPYLRKLFPIW